jgi:hypothetical protein
MDEIFDVEKLKKVNIPKPGGRKHSLYCNNYDEN